MTTITSIMRVVWDSVQEALPDHKRLYDPYNIDENGPPLLKKGWGVRIEGGTHLNKCISPQYLIDRGISVIITREALAKNSDPELREELEIELLEDLHKVIEKTYNDLTLGGLATDISYVSDGGLQEVFVEEQPFYYIEAALVVKYEQQVTVGGT